MDNNMQKLMGKEVEVYLLKCDDIVNGILFDVDDENIYIQNDLNTVVAIPKQNVKYYISAIKMDATTRQQPVQQAKASQYTVDAYIDEKYITTVSIPESIGINVCSDALLLEVWKDKKISAMLSNKVQRSVQYDIGRVDIYTTEYNNNVNVKDHNSFSMGDAGNSATMPLDFMLKGVINKK